MDCGVAFALLTDHTTSSDNTGRTALLTLSRWRHGFESRTGCQEPQAEALHGVSLVLSPPGCQWRCQGRLNFDPLASAEN